MRRQGFEELSEVKAAILETNGSLTVERQQSASTQVNYQEIINYLNRIEAILCQTERKTSTDETDETA